MITRLSKKGFTLVELLLAMALFTTVMVITTTGFIAMNRSFTRGTVKKQLSEGVQRTTEDVTRVVRALPQAQINGPIPICEPGSATPGCPIQTDWRVLCLTGARYFWGKADGENNGLYKDAPSACSATVDPNNNATQKLVDTRYKVVDFKIASTTPTGNTNDVFLFTIAGTFRTDDNNAFDDPNNASAVKCRGSAKNSAARTCAVERFSFTINARGDTQ